MIPVSVPSSAAIVSDLQTFSQSVRRHLESLEDLNLSEQVERNSQLLAGIADERRDSEDAVAFLLRTAAERLLVYSEGLGFLETRKRILAWADKWQGKLDDIPTWSNTEANGRESPAFNELEPVIEALSVLLGSDTPPPDPVERRNRELLEYGLRSLAKMCHTRGIVPTKEHECQTVMHDHLSSVFSDYVQGFSIAKPLMNFKPDGGVPSLKSAIESQISNVTLEDRDCDSWPH